MSTENAEREAGAEGDKAETDGDEPTGTGAVADEDEERPGAVEDTRPPDDDEEADAGNGVETVPSVELDLYDLSVRVSGQSTDDLDAVEGTARSLMEYLVEQAHALEDQPDDRGLN